MDFNLLLTIVLIAFVVLSLISSLVNLYITTLRAKHFKKQSEMLGKKIKQVDLELEEAKKKLMATLQEKAKN